MNVFRTVAGLLGEILSRDERDISAAFALTPENRVAPVDVAKLAIACEKAFGLSLYDEKVAAWETVGDAVRHVEELLEEGVAEPVERTDADRTAWYYE